MRKESEKMKGVIIQERKYINQADGQVIVSFQLASRDWLKLENSTEWRRVEEMILEFQAGGERA